SQASDGYDVQTANGETLLRYFATASLKDPYGSMPRDAGFVVFGEDQYRGGVTTYSARYENTRDILSEICKSTGIGYTITTRYDSSGRNYNTGLTVTQGTDRTYDTGGAGAVVFDTRLKNCRILSDSGSLSPTVAIAAADGTGYTRQYTYYGEIYSQNWIRREMFVDAGDAATSAEVQRMAELSLAEERQLSIRIQVLPTCQWKFGRDYNVGDVVTLISPDRGQLNLQIYSAESCRRASGDELYLDLGYECWSAPSLIRKVGKENTFARK
ncbi:MAG TPA: hypothetical protein O0Y10_04725, partial [Methanocorpusculum sp.]|nr:hypothetical protein [Methanocorpusculum sp.]